MKYLTDSQFLRLDQSNVMDNSEAVINEVRRGRILLESVRKMVRSFEHTGVWSLWKQYDPDFFIEIEKQIKE
jgi:hypothetical protein